MSDPNISKASDSLNVANQALDQVGSSLTLAQSTIDGLNKANSDLSSQLTVLKARKPIIYPSLETYSLFAQDKKILFQWVQPGNVGLTGGAAATVPHGTETWVPGPSGTIITWNPKNIAPKSDNAFNYMVLPYPSLPPVRMRWSAGNYSCLTPADWGHDQQSELQTEYVGGGFRYTNGWAINPKTGLWYYNKNQEKWVQLLQAGKPVLVDLSKPTNIICECSLDTVANTITFEWVVFGNRFIQVGVTLPAKPADPTLQEFSTSVQLDGEATAPAYSMVLKDHSAELS